MHTLLLQGYPSIYHAYFKIIQRFHSTSNIEEKINSIMFQIQLRTTYSNHIITTHTTIAIAEIMSTY